MSDDRSLFGRLRGRRGPEPAIPVEADVVVLPRNAGDPLLELEPAERDAIAAQVRNYADYREAAFGSFDDSETRADLSGDPAYGYDAEAMRRAVAEAEASHQRVEEMNRASIAPFRDLADQIERTGWVDLRDQSTWTLMNEVVDDTGYSVEDQESRPPADIAKVVEATFAARTERRREHEWLLAEISREEGYTGRPTVRDAEPEVEDPEREKPEAKKEVILAGYVARNVVLKRGAGGAAMAWVNVGQRSSPTAEPEYQKALLVGPAAEQAARVLRKGDEVVLTGEMRPGRPSVDPETQEVTERLPYLAATKLALDITDTPVTVQRPEHRKQRDASMAQDRSATGPLATVAGREVDGPRHH